jgi:predicted  nucleic acid-binding Zn-ribbon protein
MKSKKQIKAKIKEIREKMKTSSEEQSAIFTYWLGYLRALEWIQQQK